MADWDRLLSGCRGKLDRGFESHPPRHCPRSSVDRALGCGLRGRAFESHRERWKGGSFAALFLFNLHVTSIQAMG